MIEIKVICVVYSPPSKRISLQDCYRW